MTTPRSGRFGAQPKGAGNLGGGPFAGASSGGGGGSGGGPGANPPYPFTLAIGATAPGAIDLDAEDVAITRVVPWSKTQIPTLEFERRGIAYPAPDPWAGRTVTWTDSGTVRFAGDVLTAVPVRQDKAGWVVRYRALGLRWRADTVPVTDEATGLDTVGFNLDPTADLDYDPSRAGRTLGQMIQAVLEMPTNANRLAALGIGGYTSLAPPTLPAATLADLAALSIIPPYAVHIQGEKILGALAATLPSSAPFHFVHVDAATRAIRFLDTRQFTAATLSVGSDPIDPPDLGPDTASCFTAAVVRGQPYVTAGRFSTKPPAGSSAPDGGLAPDWAWGPNTVAQASAAWTLGDYLQSANRGADTGSCTVTDTTHLTVTSADATKSWAANAWDQSATGALGVVYASYDVGTDITQMESRRIVANTALAPGGTSVLTLDAPLPATTYNHYEIRGAVSGAALVYRRYVTTNTALGLKVMRYFPYPQNIQSADGSFVSQTTKPTASILWSSNGNAPYFEVPLGFTVQPDTTAGHTHIIFDRPTTTLYGDQGALWSGATVTDQVPTAVVVYLPIDRGSLQSAKPATGFDGLGHSLYGIQRTLYVTCPAFKDYSNQGNVDQWCQQLLDSVKDPIWEGTIVYHGKYAPALAPGAAIALAATGGQATGLESIPLPVVEAEYVPGQGTGTAAWRTLLRVSNRRAQFTGAAFLRPSLAADGMALGGGGFAAANDIAGSADPLAAWQLAAADQASAGLANTFDQGAAQGAGPGASPSSSATGD